MERNGLDEKLQTVWTLTEHPIIYRSTLAPVMLFVGIMGLVAMGIGLFFHLNSTRQFCVLWLIAAVVTITGAFLIAHRQALKNHEPFWFSPKRRVAQALWPPLAAGFCASVLIATVRNDLAPLTSFVWILFYGCALHSAGFFAPRLIRFLGLLFIICSCGLLCAFRLIWKNSDPNPQMVMGFFFGALHVACGAYFYLDRKGK